MSKIFLKLKKDRPVKGNGQVNFGELEPPTDNYCPNCFHDFMIPSEIIFGSIDGKTFQDCEGNCPKCDHKHRIKDRLDKQQMREMFINKL